MQKEKHQHVIMSGRGWAVRTEGEEMSSKRFDTRREAIIYAREKVNGGGAMIKVHTRDGRIREDDGSINAAG